MDTLEWAGRSLVLGAASIHSRSYAVESDAVAITLGLLPVDTICASAAACLIVTQNARACTNFTQLLPQN